MATPPLRDLLRRQRLHPLHHAHNRLALADFAGLRPLSNPPGTPRPAWRARSALVLLIGSQVLAVRRAAQPANARVHAYTDIQFDVLRGGFKQVFDLSVDDGGNVWGAGLGGILHRERDTWRVVAARGSIAEAIDVDAPGDGWALVGGQLWRYDGTAWAAVESPAGYVLDVALTESKVAWALAGKDGSTVLWRYDELGEWREAGVRLTAGYNTLDVVGDAVWLSGLPGIARCEGSDCSSFSVSAVNDMDMLDPDNGWAVGGDCGPGGARHRVILRYNAGEWRTLVDSEDAGLNTVTAVSRASAIAGGANGVVVRITEEGVNTPTTEPGPGARCVGGLGASTRHLKDRAVILGGFSDAGAAIVIAPDDGETAWVHGYGATRLAFRQPEEGWVIEDGELLGHASGSWVIQSAGEPPWNDVSVAGDGMAWAAGNAGRLAVNRAGEWREIDLAIQEVLLRVVPLPGETAFLLARGRVAQENRTLVFRTDSRSVDLLYEGNTDLPRDMAVAPDGAVWIVGRGFALEGRGTEWHRYATGTDLFAVTGTEKGVWAVASDAPYRWTGSAWEPDTRFTPELADEVRFLSLRGIHAHSAEDVWATGRDGSVLHFDGARWDFASRGLVRPGGWFSDNEWLLRDATTISDGSERVLLVAGDSATVMRHRYVPEANAAPSPTATPRNGRRVCLPRIDSS